MKIVFSVLLGLLAAFFTHKHLGGRYYTHKSKYVLDGMTGRATFQGWRVVVFENDEVIAPQPAPAPQPVAAPEPTAKDFRTLWKESEERAMSKWPILHSAHLQEDFKKFIDDWLAANPAAENDPTWPEKVGAAYVRWRGLPAK